MYKSDLYGDRNILSWVCGAGYLFWITGEAGSSTTQLRISTLWRLLREEGGFWIPETGVGGRGVSVYILESRV